MPTDENQPSGPQIIPDRASEDHGDDPAPASEDGKDPNDEQRGAADPDKPDSF